MTVLSLLNPLAWFGGGGNDRYRAKLTEGGSGETASLDPRGRPIGAESALQVAAFWACVRIISETIATLPLQLFAKTGNGRDAQTSHQLYPLLHDQPNADHTAMEFLEGIVAYLAVGGNSYVLKERIGSRLVALTLLRTPLMNAKRDANGDLVYRYTDRGKVETFSDDEIMHVRGFGFGDDFGLSALSYARRTLAISLAADEVVDRTYANGMKMSGWFKYKGGGGSGILTKEQRDKAHKLLVEPYVGAGNAAKVGILEGDFDWIAASMPMADAQLLESRRFGVEDVCRWLGVPPILIGHAAQGQTMWGSGVEQIMLGWLAMGLRPYLVRIEQAIKKSLLTAEDKGKGLYAEFNVDGLLRADSKARSENYSRLGQNGVLTRNEIRALENMPAMPGGDVLTVQSNLVPIDKLGEIDVAPTPGEPVRGGGARTTTEEDAPSKIIDRLVDLLEAKYSTDQPRDSRGRFAAGGGDGGDAGGGDDRQATHHITRGRVALGIIGAGAAVLAMDVLRHRKVPYRSHTHSYFDGFRQATDKLHTGSVATPLTSAEIGAVVNYTGTAFAKINRGLRLGHKLTDQVAAIDAAIGKASLAENTVVYRGINLDRSKRLLNKTSPGDVFVDRGYSSTTLSEKTARQFAGAPKGITAGISDDPEKHGYVMSINVEKGAQALPLSTEKGLSQSSFLHEVLLPRASAFKVLAVDHGSKTIVMQHLGVAGTAEAAASKSVTDLGELDDPSEADRFLACDAHLEFYPAPDDDTTAQDYAGYRPPQPEEAPKAFNPGQPRDDQGQWSDGGGGGGGTGSGSDVWAEVGSVAKSVAIGAALTASAAAMVALAPELFALAGGAAAGTAAVEAGLTAAEAVAAATQAGRLVQVTQLVRGAASAMYQTAAFKAGAALLTQLGVDPRQIEDELKPLTDLVKAAPKPLSGPRLRQALTDACAAARDAMIEKLGGSVGDPGIAECRKTIRDAYRAFVADKLT